MDSWTPTDPEKVIWDVLVVGTGMGGGTLGHALAKAGRRVLFVEKGRSSIDPACDALRKNFAEEYFNAHKTSAVEQAKILAREGRSTDIVEDVSIQGKKKEFVPFIGGGTGGSSAIYGMVLERLFKSDFTPRANYPGIANSTLPEAWPVSFEEMNPWYTEAERLYRVRGAADPLRPGDPVEQLMPPPTLTAANAELFSFFEKAGLHPYQAHMACENLPECQTCQGYLCSSACKNDSNKICLAPALEQHGAQMLTECLVEILEADHSKVRRIHALWKGKKILLQAKFIVLAAGALVTPTILLRSANAHWPHGLANQSDQVGRNLMRHCIDLLLVSPKLRKKITGQTKEISFNDFYQTPEGKFGTVQSFGPVPPLSALLNRPGFGYRMLGLLRPVLRRFWNTTLARSTMLAPIMEDLPYADNRVTPAGGLPDDGRQRIRLNYHLHPNETARLEAFRSLMTDVLRPYKPMMLRGAHDNSGIAHVCGTARFGNDPKTSVLDRNNQAHGVDNLYVVDASFFPSSGGLNPSLTIAANALRVADHLKERF